MAKMGAHHFLSGCVFATLLALKKEVMLTQLSVAMFKFDLTSDKS